MRRKSSLTSDREGITPVIATVLLVAVTIATAIVTALWMGALTLTYQRSEELVVTQVILQGNVATFYVSNKGTSDVTITRIQVSGSAISQTANSYAASGTNPVPKGGTSTLTITVTFTGGQTAFVSSTRYDFVLVTSQSHLFPATAIA